MTTGFHQTTAKIYQFPVKAWTSTKAYGDAARLVAEIRSSNACAAAPSSGWYHEDAVRETQRPVKP